MSDSPSDATLTISPDDPRPQPRSLTAPYLLVIDGHSSQRWPLPESGELLIGRAEDCTLRLSDRTASRHHARLSIEGSELLLFDLGSHNGTRVLGQRVVGSRKLQHGDVIQICEVTLVLHAPQLQPVGHELAPISLFRQRLAEEVERSQRYGRPLQLLCLQADEHADIARLTLTLTTQARLIDVLSRQDSLFFVLLPELTDDERQHLVTALHQKMQQISASIRCGIASFPADGNDAEHLMLSAQAAATMAPAGSCLLAEKAQRTQLIGEHEVTIADPAMQRIFALIERLARSTLPVLIHGETGTGKEIAATALHVFSKRSGRFVAVNCAALPEALAESELFGHEKGAFTGAVSQKLGLLEQAAQGTLFLDEVGELPLLLQAKLLRALESQRIVRVGGTRELPIDVRLVTATHRDLEEEVRQGRFRQDLFFRLVAARVVLPPLRDRRREIPILLRQFLRRAASSLGAKTPSLSDGALSLLLTYNWPGNIRELRNICDYLAATCVDGVVTSEEVSGLFQSADGTKRAGAPTAAATVEPASAPPVIRNLEAELRELEQRRMSEALAACNGVQVRAAELLGMPIRTFSYKLKQYGLTVPNRTSK